MNIALEIPVHPSLPPVSPGSQRRAFKLTSPIGQLIQGSCACSAHYEEFEFVVAVATVGANPWAGTQFYPATSDGRIASYAELDDFTAIATGITTALENMGYAVVTLDDAQIFMAEALEQKITELGYLFEDRDLMLLAQFIRDELPATITAGSTQTQQ